MKELKYIIERIKSERIQVIPNEIIDSNMNEVIGIGIKNQRIYRYSMSMK